MTEPTSDVTPDPPAQAKVELKSEPEKYAEAVKSTEDATDWKAEARKWEQRAKENQKVARDGEAAKTAAEQKQQELLDGFAKVLGVKSDDAPPDPGALQQALAGERERAASLASEIRARDVELAAWRSATGQNVNAKALLDSRSFATELARLDPAADDFTTQLDAAVKKAVEGNPALRANPVPTPGAAGIGVSGSNGDASVTPGLGRLRQAYSTQ